MRTSTLILVLVAAALSACADGDGPIAPDPSFMQASVSGDLELTHDGGASFYSGFHHIHEYDRVSVYSKDQEHDQTLYLQLIGTQVLPEGSALDVHAIDWEDPSTDGLSIMYIADNRRYFASTGSLTASHVGPDSIRASFSFRAFRYCEDPEPGESCGYPAEPPADASWIEVEGEFLATPSTPPEPLDQ